MSQGKIVTGQTVHSPDKKSSESLQQCSITFFPSRFCMAEAHGGMGVSSSFDTELTMLVTF